MKLEEEIRIVFLHVNQIYLWADTERALLISHCQLCSPKRCALGEKVRGGETFVHPFGR